MQMTQSSLDATIDALPRDRLLALAERYATRAMELGLAITQPDGTRVAIPPILSPVVLEPSWLARIREDVRRVAELIRRVAAALLAGPERVAMLEALDPFERQCAIRAGIPTELATVRADLFLGAAGPRALELNATIPAMQGYGDIALRAFLEAVCAEIKLDPEPLIRVAGENAVALLTAVRGFYRQRTGRELASVALVHRPMDSQLSELTYLAARWSRAGVRAEVVEGNQVRFRGESLEVRGRTVDLIYRHIFARRVEPRSDLGQMLLAPQRWPVVNAMSAPLEMKSTFAALSSCAHHPEMAARFHLSVDDVELIQRLIPWTRQLRSGPATLPDGVEAADLLAQVIDRPEQFVLKRSWDYGGKAVFLGIEREEPSTLERARSAFGEALAWPALVRRCEADRVGGGFVVQERVPTSRVSRLVCGGAQGPQRRDLFEDLSVYASVGLLVSEWGAVVRGSHSAVVNIASGGGVAPVLPADLAQRLTADLRGSFPAAHDKGDAGGSPL